MLMKILPLLINMVYPENILFILKLIKQFIKQILISKFNK